MPLHPVIAAALASAAGIPGVHTLPVPQARVQAKAAYPRRPDPVAVGSVHDRSIAGPAGPIPVRIYTPEAAGPHAVLVFFHGSGFVLLDLDTHDDVCRRLCRGAGCVVVSVDYRLAPEHTFPAGPDDCLAAVRWVGAHAAELDGDPMRIAVAGDSAGGCLAAVTAMRVRDEGGPALAGQLLFYPVTNYPAPLPQSYRAFGAGCGLTHEGMKWYWDQYLGDLGDGELTSHPHASPLRADSFAHLPDAYVLVAEYDVLRDEGEAFASRLQDSGVRTVSRRCAGMNHGFLKYAGVIPEVDAALQQACDWLRVAYRR